MNKSKEKNVLHLLNKVLFIFLVGAKKRQQEVSYICIKQRKKKHKYMIVLEKNIWKFWVNEEMSKEFSRLLYNTFNYFARLWFVHKKKDSYENLC